MAFLNFADNMLNFNEIFACAFATVEVITRVVKYEKMSIKFRKMRVLVAIVFRLVGNIYCILLVL